jgi:Domain of unknown function (DUF4595) with porin-like fold
MKKLLIVLSAATVFASCKKEDAIMPLTTVTPTSTVTKKLTKNVYVYDTDAPQTAAYTYDAQGRVSVYKQQNSTTTFNYVSASLMIATDRSNTDNSVMGIRDCELNAMGYVTKILVKNLAGEITYTYQYTYNTDGYMTSRKGTYPNGSNHEIVYVISGGNAVSSKLYYENILDSHSEYTFDNTKFNKSDFTHGSYWYSHGLFGKRSKNLMSEIKTHNASGTLTWHALVTFEMDADGYPVKQTSVFPLQGKQAVDTYTYE